MEKSRREFLLKAGSASLFATLGISLAACGSSGDDNIQPLPPTAGTPADGVTVSDNLITIDLANAANTALQNQGNWRVFTGVQIILINVTGDNFRAFTSICPHQACDRNWSYSAGGQQLTCSCHNSVFSSVNGNRVSGPATRNLQEFAVSRQDNSLTVTKS